MGSAQRTKDKPPYTACMKRNISNDIGTLGRDAHRMLTSAPTWAATAGEAGVRITSLKPAKPPPGLRGDRGCRK